LELHHFYEWNDYTERNADCDEEKATENADVVEGELESLASILTEQEFQNQSDNIGGVLAHSASSAL